MIDRGIKMWLTGLLRCSWWVGLSSPSVAHEPVATSAVASAQVCRMPTPYNISLHNVCGSNNNYTLNCIAICCTSCCSHCQHSVHYENDPGLRFRKGFSWLPTIHVTVNTSNIFCYHYCDNWRDSEIHSIVAFMGSQTETHFLSIVNTKMK